MPLFLSHCMEIKGKIVIWVYSKSSFFGLITGKFYLYITKSVELNLSSLIQILSVYLRSEKKNYTIIMKQIKMLLPTLPSWACFEFAEAQVLALIPPKK